MIKITEMWGIVEGLTRLNERRVRNQKLEEETTLIRENNRIEDTLKEQRSEDIRPQELPMDAVLVLQKSMEVRRDDIADDKQRAETQRNDIKS